MTDGPSRLHPTRITDPKAVAVITHPLRMRLLGELARRGRARVVDLAEDVGAPPKSVSFHVRQLARYGLIEPARDAGSDGRERWWQPTSDRAFEIDEDAMRRQPGGEAAVGVLGRVAEDHVLALHRATHERSGHPHVIQDDFALRLSDEELRDLRTDIVELFDCWGALFRDRAAAEDGQERRPYYGIVLGALVDDIERAASGRDLS